MNELQYQMDLIGAMNEKLSSERNMMELIINTSTSAFIYYNYARDELKIMGCWDSFFNFQIRKISDLQMIIDALDERYYDEIISCLNADSNGEQRHVCEAMLYDSRRFLEFETNILYDADKHPTDKIIRIKDITKARTQNEELSYMAYYDILTGLYNRNYFIRLLGDMIRKASQNNKEVAVMFIDIDDFRKINDGMGLVIGDELMMDFGQFLSTLASDNVIVSHFNGDRYCIASYDPHGSTLIDNIYQTIRRRTKQPFKTADGRELYITITAGVAYYPEASSDCMELINCSEIVLYRAKNDGKNSIQFFDSQILSEFLNNVFIENKLREAIFDMNFMMYYQPQFYASSGELRGVEALIRWKDSEKGLISPSLFIPLAEKNGTIVPIGYWVIEESIRTYIKWREEYNTPFILSVNISAMQYKRDDFVEKLIAIVEKYHMDPHELELEITETALIDNYRNIIGKLNLLRDYGIRISMDDFGTGYSSLSYLKSLPIDTLKIDKSFVDTILSDETSNIIMESIMHMVKRLGLETVAEGVENEAQLDYLREINCDCIQGFLLGKPQPGEDIKQFLSDKQD